MGVWQLAANERVLVDAEECAVIATVVAVAGGHRVEALKLLFSLEAVTHPGTAVLVLADLDGTELRRRTFRPADAAAGVLEVLAIANNRKPVLDAAGGLNKRLQLSYVYDQPRVD